MTYTDALAGWTNRTVMEPLKQFRWTFLPPLMVYFAAGVSGLTAVVGTFFIKDYLGLSAAFLAGLAFWAGIPWTLKLPLGHLVDLIWRWKAILVFIGAGLITASIMIMYGLIAHTDAMAAVMSPEAWYVISALLAPTGYVVQDVVADAMTVEAVPGHDDQGNPLPDKTLKAMHITMQMLGRIAIIGGLIFVASLNIFMFTGIEDFDEAMKAEIYAKIYLAALAIPAISITGVILAGVMLRARAKALRREGLSQAQIKDLLLSPEQPTKPNWWILGGSVVFVAFTLSIGLGEVSHAQEIAFAGSMAIVLFLMSRILKELDERHARALIGTAIIIFAFRAVPLPGAGQTWFQIDVLGFDQRFLSILNLIASGLALVGLFILRPLMAEKSIAYIVVLLTILGGILALPNIGLYYGVHDWTAALTGGVVDARFIAIIDTAAESPFAQVAMVPMLAWIARNAPAHLKATFFAVMASFTNLALSASSLSTKYINEIFLITREVKDRSTGVIETAADYSQLGMLLIMVALIVVIAPLLVIFMVQNTRFKTDH